MAIDRPQDRRQFGRRPVFKQATITQANGERLQATVLDISQGGARIKLADPNLVQGEFYLEIPEDDFIVKCRVMRIEEATIGAEFIKAPRRLSWLGK